MLEIIGSGTVSEVTPGKVYRIRHNIGRDPQTGRYLKSPWKTVHCNKRQARDELARYKQELIEAEEARLHPAKRPVPTIREFAEEYLMVRTSTKNLSENTLKHNRCDIDHVCSLFGDYAMDNLTASMINKKCAAYRAATDASLNVLHRIAKMLKTLYRRAMIEGIIEYRQNPCFGIDIDRPAPADRHSLTIEEFKRLEAVVNDAPMDAHITGVKLGIATGMRKGEVLGLQWKYVDLEGHRISVVQQLSQAMVFKPPKSRAGNRSMHVDDDTVEYLKRWKEFQRQQLAENGVEQTENTLVVCREAGQFFDPRLYSRWFRDFCLQHDFGKYTNTEEYFDNQGKHGYKRRRKSGYVGLCFHELRHTQATLLIGNGCDIKTVQHRLGHADVQTTLNIYSHNIDANDEAAAAAIAALKA